jgi:hypothetical protein
MKIVKAAEQMAADAEFSAKYHEERAKKLQGGEAKTEREKKTGAPGRSRPISGVGRDRRPLLESAARDRNHR